MSVTVVEEATESDITETEVRKGLSLNCCIIDNFLSCIDDHDDRRHQETPDEILKNVILKLGEVVSA